MMLISLFLFLACLLSCAATDSTRVVSDFAFADEIAWLQIDRSVLVRLETPNIPLYVWDHQKEAIFLTNNSSAVVLNFTLSLDHRTLLLQDQPFLPLPDSSIPPLLQAYQIPADEPVSSADPDRKLPPLSLDYDRQVYPRDDNSIHYANYHPTVSVDILGAGTRKTVGIALKDSGSFPAQDPRTSSLQILRVWLADRLSEESPIYISRPCRLWSWRCADLGESPWYRSISSQDFDEYGRIGSLRHLLVKRWTILCVNIGFTRFLIFAIVSVSVMLWPTVHRLHRHVRRIRARHIADKAELADWLADEEEGDVFLSDRDFIQRERRFKESIEEASWSPQRPVDTLPASFPKNSNLHASSQSSEKS